MEQTCSKLIYWFNAVPIRIPADFLVERWADSKIYTELQGAQNSQNSLFSRRTSRTIHTLWLQTYYKSNRDQDGVVTGTRTGIQIQGSELRVQKYAMDLCSISFSIKVASQSNGGKKNLFNQWSGTLGELYANEWNWTLTSHQIQKLTQCN